MPPSPPPSGPPRIFDRRLHARRRALAAATFAEHSFLKEAVAKDFVARLSGINRKFDRVLELGAQDGSLSRLIASDPLSADRVGAITTADLSPAYGADLVVDEEALLFPEASYDLVISALSLHWVNDLPGALIQIRRILRPDGLFIGAVFGGRTLTELRQCLLAAEEEARGGASRRISPFLDVIDGAGLLQRAGFALPVADTDTLTVRYRDPMRLLADLKGMGETAAFAGPAAKPLTRAILARAMDIYRQRFADPDGKVRTSFEIVTLSGWSPAPTQQQPLKPGSATTRLADVLGVKEQGAGEKTGPKR